MLIEIPILVAFDRDPRVDNLPAGSRSFTLRYSTDACADVLAQWTDHYPPRPDAVWVTDASGVILSLLSHAADREISRRADRNPETYAVSEMQEAA